jgi:hypothetical protein
MTPTVNPRLTRKKTRRVVDTFDYAAFTRRIVRAYGRRIAAGDIEALPGLALLSRELDEAILAAVKGLREFGYPWSEIATRLGITRQAAQQRFGHPSERPRLDPRLKEAGLGLTVALLAVVYADHHPGDTDPEACPTCGQPYPLRERLCPSGAFAAKLLRTRRHEDPRALGVLTPAQRNDLYDLTSSPGGRTTTGSTPGVRDVLGPPQTSSPPHRFRHHPDLFGSETYTPPGGST